MSDLTRMDAAIEALPDCRAIAAELMRQPEFFEFHRAELPDNPSQRPILALARYNGQRSGQEEQVNLRVGAMRSLGMSDRAIERECGVDRRTIPYRIAALEKSGRIPAVKDRVLMRTADLAERSALILSVLMDRAEHEVSAELAAMIKALATTHGITIEKLQLLTGSPTEIVQQMSASPRDETEAWLRENAIPIAAEVTPIDSASNGNPLELAQSGPIYPSGHGQDTTTPPAAAVAQEIATTSASASERAKGAGGGRPPDAGAVDVMG